MATNAGFDVFNSVFDDLCDPFGVGEELTCNAHGVNTSFCNCLCAHFCVHSACANHRDIDKFLDVSNVFEVAVFRHIHRGMCPVP